MIKVENLHKSFGDLEVLKGISMEVKKGEVELATELPRFINSQIPTSITMEES